MRGSAKRRNAGQVALSAQAPADSLSVAQKKNLRRPAIFEPSGPIRSIGHAFTGRALSKQRAACPTESASTPICKGVGTSLRNRAQDPLAASPMFSGPIPAAWVVARCPREGEPTPANGSGSPCDILSRGSRQRRRADTIHSGGGFLAGRPSAARLGLDWPQARPRGPWARFIRVRLPPPTPRQSQPPAPTPRRRGPFDTTGITAR